LLLRNTKYKKSNNLSSYRSHLTKYHKPNIIKGKQHNSYISSDPYAAIVPDWLKAVVNHFCLLLKEYSTHTIPIDTEPVVSIVDIISLIFKGTGKRNVLSIRLQAVKTIK
jgi:hypothetical protein